MQLLSAASAMKMNVCQMTTVAVEQFAIFPGFLTKNRTEIVISRRRDKIKKIQAVKS